MKQIFDTRCRLAACLFLSLCLLFLTVACTGGGGGAGQEAERPLLTVTIEPVRYFTEAIAGSRFRVNSMVPKGSSPESYDPTPRQLMALADSRAYLRIGYIGFEQVWMERMAANAPRMQLFDLSEGVSLITDTDEEADAEAAVPGEPHAHADEGTASHHHHHHSGGIEPHIWSSPANARILADNILGALCSLDPQHAGEFRQRHDSLCLRLAHTDSIVRATLARPDAGHAFLIYHPALSYFARDYGLRQIAIEAGGKEPTAARLKSLIDLCRREQVRVVFVQPEFDRRNAELIARQIDARIVTVNPLAYDWEEEMIRVAENLKNTLP